MEALGPRDFSLRVATNRHAAPTPAPIPPAGRSVRDVVSSGVPAESALSSLGTPIQRCGVCLDGSPPGHDLLRSNVAATSAGRADRRAGDRTGGQRGTLRDSRLRDYGESRPHAGDADPGPG